MSTKAIECASDEAKARTMRHKVQDECEFRTYLEQGK
jgi:hypothetical protein